VTRILGIGVEDELMESWTRWLAPDPQPFLVATPGAWPECDDEGGVITAELQDTYRLWWGVERGSEVLWISERQFHQLPKPTRAALVREQVNRRRGAVPTVRSWQVLLGASRLRGIADGHRFVWWPSLVAPSRAEILRRVVSDGRLPSRHEEVSEDTWRDAEAILPEARRLAGTFPTGSNTNCFGSVLRSAGADSAAVYDDVAPFDAWLEAVCKPGGDARQPGVVLVWRGSDGRAIHAAVTIGDEWGLEKQSKDWHSPFAVASVKDIMRMSRHPGERLHRHSIVR
jgi:hypothetical protein